MKRKMQIACSFFFLSTLLLFLHPSTGYACSCVQPPPVQNALDDASAVFSGKVVDIEEQTPVSRFISDILTTFSDDEPDFPQKTVVLEVTSTWKGVSTSQITVKTGLGGGDCGFEFAVGQTYLVYAHGDDLHTSVCTRTTELSAANEDLSVLGQGKPPAEQVTQTDRSFIWLLIAGLAAAAALFARRIVKR